MLGLRDNALLESALSRPENLKLYNSKATIFDEISILVCGIIKNYPFVDGNKRVGAVVCEFALLKAGFQLNASEEEKYIVFMNIAAGLLSESDLSYWLSNHLLIK